jgi:hypothetical protein
VRAGGNPAHGHPGGPVLARGITSLACRRRRGRAAARLERQAHRLGAYVRHQQADRGQRGAHVAGVVTESGVESLHNCPLELLRA